MNEIPTQTPNPFQSPSPFQSPMQSQAQSPTQTPFFADVKSAEKNDQPKSLVYYKRKIYLAVFLSIPFLASMFFAWKSVGDLIMGESSYGWSLPIVLFSIGVSLLLLLSFVISNPMFFFLSALASVAMGLFVFHGASSAAYIVLSALLIWYGTLRIQKDLPKNIHVDIRKSIRQGSSYVIFGLSLAIACTYYFAILNMNFADLMKQFEIRKSSERMVNQAMGILNPDFKQMDETNVTVDEFLIAIQKSQETADQVSPETKPAPMTDEELLRIAKVQPTDPKAPAILAEIKKQMNARDASTAEAQQKLLLDQSRKQFATIVGQPLTGQEAIADIFSDVIEKSIWSHVQATPDQNTSSSTLAFVLSVILFITLVSIGSLLKILWIFFVKICFHGLVRTELVRVKKVSIEQEVIE